jgi:rhodanese-related sulfurtransferase
LAASQDIKVFDARKPGEFSAEHMDKAISTPLDYLDDHMAELTGDEKKYMHCAGGYRSVIANSLLKAKGIHNVVDILGGYGAMKKVDTITRTDYVCPSTLK